MKGVKAKKSLGQHFLADKNIARKIVSSLNYSSPVDVLEIGPGTGVLTQFLVQEPNCNLLCVELDSESVALLHKEYPQLNGKIIEGDVLKLSLGGIFPGKFSVVGNLPYNISSEIFFKLIESKELVNEAVFMIQKEMADRISAPHGSKTYGITSILLQAFFDIKYLFTVSETVFIPPPKVKSAVVKFTRNQTTELGCNEKMFKLVVKTAFNQRRKTMRNSLKSLIPPHLVSNAIFDKRPEQLSIAEFIDLTNFLQELK